MMARAAITNVQVVGTTSTQALISYAAPDGNPCRVEVSEAAGFLPLVPDVDPALFPGSNQDQRPGSISSGQQRLVVTGKRAAEVAADGRRRSRALQANTQHYFRITCGTDQTTGTFQTANIPLGKTYGEVVPADRDHPGQYSWPEMVWSDASPRMIDPLTGLLYKPLTRPGSIGQHFTNQQFQSALELGSRGEFSNPGGATTARAAIHNTGREGWLYLRTRGFTIPPGATWTEGGYSLDYFQVQWKAWGDPVEVCLTIDAATCASAIRKVTLPAQRAQMTVGTQDTNLSFWTDGTHVVNRPDVVRRSGAVAVDGSGAVSYAGGDVFNPHWTAGSHITIGKSECRINSLVSDQRLLITPAACQPALTAPVKGVPYTADNFGVLVRSATGGTFSVDSAVFHYGITTEPGWPAGAHTLFCADALVPDTSSPVQSGFHCNIQGGIFWINPATAEARFLGTTVFLNTTAGGDHVQGCWVDAAAFDPSNPNRFYCLSSTDKGLPVILRGEYTGSHKDLGPIDPGSAQIQANWTNLTPASQNRDLLTLLHQFDAAFDPLFSNCLARGATSGGKLLVTCQRGPQDTLGWEVVVDTAAGAIAGAYKSWDKQPGRWCKLHSSAAVIGSDSWVRIEFSANHDTTDPGGGAWVSQITSGAIPAGAVQACPSNSFGATNNCYAVTVQGEPCDISPGGGEPLNCPYNPKATYLMDSAAGDLFAVDNEWLRLVAKTGNQWVLQRDLQGLGLAAHAANSYLAAQCSTNLAADLTFWNFAADPHGANSGGKSVMPDTTGTSHSSVAKDSVQGSADWHACPQGSNGACLSVRTGNDVSDWISQPASSTPWIAPTFAGQTGYAWEDFIESYSTFPPTSPSAPDRSWFLHNRPVTNDPGVTRLTTVSGQLYKVAAPQLNRKILPTLATCGPHPVVDVSGPGSKLTGDASDSYRYCVAAAAGECTAGSSTGDIYANCPAVGTPLNAACTGGTDDQGVCFADNGSYVQSVVQVSTKIRSNSGQDSRTLTNGFRPYRAGDTYWNSRVLPDGSWAMVWTEWFRLQRSEAFLAKLPPFPAADNVDRTNFESVGLYVSGMNGATQAVVEFGYAENGPSDKLYCTSRQETCVRGNQTGSDYSFAFEPVTSVPCQGGCTIQIPGIPGRVLYYRARYLNDSGQTVLTGPTAATVVP
jgi:hypothetical protein